MIMVKIINKPTVVHRIQSIYTPGQKSWVLFSAGTSTAISPYSPVNDRNLPMWNSYFSPDFRSCKTS